jgi:hypothetical protein
MIDFKTILPVQKLTLLSFVILIFNLFSCKNEKNETDIDLTKITINTPIIRLDSALMHLKSKEEVLKFLNDNENICSQYFDVPIQDFPAFSEKLFSFVSNPALANFYSKSINTPNGISTDSLYNALNQAFKHIKFYYPTLKAPKIYTMFSGFSGKDLMVSDTAIVIGLDYFVGKNATYRPQLYDYQLVKYEKNYIVPSILNHFATKYSKTNLNDKTLLAEMVFYGKCYAFTKTMIPDAPDSLIIDYTGKQLEDTEVSQELVWGHFIDQKLLYENSPFKKAKYLEEKPSVPEISPDCPGMIGRWLGWKIVKKFIANNSEVSIQQLMADENAQLIFEKSKYKGKPDSESN